MTEQTYTTKLRPIEPSDIDLIYKIENDPEIWPVSATTAPYSRQLLTDYILNSTGDIFTDKQVRLVVTTQDGEAVGLADLQNFDPKNIRAELGITILQQYRRQGLATSAINQLINYAQTTVHLHQVYAIVPADNKPSAQTLLKCGFKQQATLKHWLYNGADYHDAIFFQRIL